jgi:uncharacterized protein YndB with AHSA1/START domain
VTGDRRGLVLELRWLLQAPRERVFGALTEPAVLAAWWGPSGFTVPEIELDLTVGGRYRFGMQPPEGHLFHLTGEFVDIRRPRLLAYTFRWEEPDPEDQETTVTLSLDALDDATLVLLSQGEFRTDSRLALHRDGWTDSLVKLRRVLLEPG